jgi:hypothetical protein
MSAIQNIKNFIRHGKQAKAAHAEPATSAPAVHGQITIPAAGEPGTGQHAAGAPLGGHSADAAAPSTDQKKTGKEFDPAVLERIVAEERENRAKLPRYPGLERWALVEKMGDGAFSNVYRARDRDGQYGEVAIKVVRKFEMNNQQVSAICFSAPHTRRT